MLLVFFLMRQLMKSCPSDIIHRLLRGILFLLIAFLIVFKPLDVFKLAKRLGKCMLHGIMRNRIC